MAGLDELTIGGLGSSRANLDNTRFVRGRGNFIEDFKVPDMLNMMIVRSPHAHARIKSINVERALKIPGVYLVMTAETVAENSTWLSMLTEDTQPVFAVDKVRYVGQEVACVVATTPYVARDGCAAIEVEYELLPAVVNPFQGAEAGAPVIRDDKAGQTDNVAYTWESGDAAETDRAFAAADVVSRVRVHIPRAHPGPVENVGALAHYNPVHGFLTMYANTQVPHVLRSTLARVAGMAEHMIRVISPDVGGAFGAKMPVYPAYLAAVLASIKLELPVRWMEDRTGSLTSVGWARDAYLVGELALQHDGKMLGVRVKATTDNGAFLGNAHPTKYDAGMLHAAFACYDVPAGHVALEGAYTNKAPGNVANRGAFRVAEAMFLQERLVDVAAADLGIDPAELRRRNLLKDNQFPHATAFGLTVDSGRYGHCLDTALEAIGYDEFLRTKEDAAANGRRIGIGIATAALPLGASGRDHDVLGIKTFESAFLRVHLTGKAILRVGLQNSGQDEEVTLAQVVAHELGISAKDVFVEQGDTMHTPVGTGAHAGAAVSMAARKVLNKARTIASHLLEASEEDLEWELGRFHIRGVPTAGVSIQDIAMAAYGNMPDGLEPGLEWEAYYNGPNYTWPFACYVVAVEVDAETGEWKVLRVVAVDDCGVRINPGVVERQIMGGLTDAYGQAKMQLLTFDAAGNPAGYSAGNPVPDYVQPMTADTPTFELHEVVTLSPDHPLGAKVGGESASMNGPAAFVNAVLNAIADTGVRNIDMPLLPDRVWEAITTGSDVTGVPPVAGGE